MLIHKRGLLTAGLFAATLAAPVSQAYEVAFTIENLTNAITFRPFLVAAHPRAEPVFKTGESAVAFDGMQAVAECGGLSSLVDRMDSVGADIVANPVNIEKPFDPPLGLLFPAGVEDGDTAVPFDAGLAGSVSGTLEVSRGNSHLSVVAMLLPTNDAFAGLDSFRIPRKRGTYVLFLNAYDAGTETNNEVPADDDPLDCVVDEPGYPVDPLGRNGTGGTGLASPDVSDRMHIHRGQLGDLDRGGGVSDLDSSVHRWLNPVVKLTLVVKPKDRDDEDDDKDKDDKKEKKEKDDKDDEDD